MKNLLYLFTTLSFVLFSCGGGANKADQIKAQTTLAAPATLEEAEKSWAENNGIGPIKSFTLPAEIDQDLAAKGQKIYDAMCTACHKPDKQFIGPAPKGVLEKRTPSWVMNMILNPEEMVAKDPIARQLLIKFNGSPMANQNLTEEEARAVLEYFRTL